ncbi:hypothetical protein ACFPH9_06000 [Brevundimonas bullata]
MTGVFQLLAVLFALAALGWGAVKFGDVVAEAVDPDSRRQLRQFVRVLAVAVAVVLGGFIAVTALTAVLWGTGCERVLDPMACPAED